jgi:NAD(P)-dependent dehydrogenase (short-subunit alcohol dehydrogenase family)
VFITGGTRGLGLALARQFLAEGSRVFITGRSETSVAAGLAELARGAAGVKDVAGGHGDAADPAALHRLATEAAAFFGAEADLVIVNAGINQPRGRLWEVDFADAAEVLRVDLSGPFAAAGVFMPRLIGLSKGGERAGLWFVEGHGSNGRIQDGLSVYGSAKRGLAYFWRALAVEARSTGVVVGALSPGIMATDFVLDPERRGSPEEWERTKRVLNILADRAETVAAFAVPRILACEKNGSLVAWLTRRKAFARFAMAGFRKRSVID